jgi:phosphoribosylanthranilate isomerase
VSARTRIKFCGMTSSEEIALAVEAGADAVGVILAESPRRVPLAALAALGRAVPPFVSKVAVLVDPDDAELEAAVRHGFTVQFSGAEDPERCRRVGAANAYVKVFHVKSDQRYDAEDIAALDAYAGALWQFDTRVEGTAGGTGVPFAWRVVEPLARRRRLVVSGGLTPQNVAECVTLVRPYAVDVRGGVETDGMKDPEKMRDFVRAVRAADAQA